MSAPVPPTEAPAVETAALAGLPVSLADIRAARERIMGSLHRTPLLSTASLSRMTNTDLRLKAENLQRTGSFKSRGALNAILQLGDAERARGVVTFSAGNHGQGLAFAAGKAGVRCTVFMASNAVQAKVDAIRGYGADVVFGDTIADAYAAMERTIAEKGVTFISPFDNVNVVAGQGVVGLEILEDDPDVEQIVVPIGGGGLISGIALAVKSLRPEVRVVGVEPEGANVVLRSLQAGRVVRMESLNTIADGLAAPFAGEITQAIIARCVDDIVLVTDDEIRAAMEQILVRTKLLAEPAGAAATAALLAGKAGAPAGANTVALLSGGNVSLDRLKELLPD